MTLKKQFHLRNHDIILNVFRGVMDKKLLFSFGKVNSDGTIKGPLFTEDEMYELADLILDYDEWESCVVNGKANKRLVSEPEKVSLEDVRIAIETIKQTPANTYVSKPIPIILKKQHRLR